MAKKKIKCQWSRTKLANSTEDCDRTVTQDEALPFCSVHRPHISEYITGRPSSPSTDRIVKACYAVLGGAASYLIENPDKLEFCLELARSIIGPIFEIRASASDESEAARRAAIRSPMIAAALARASTLGPRNLQELRHGLERIADEAVDPAVIEELVTEEFLEAIRGFYRQVREWSSDGAT